MTNLGYIANPCLDKQERNLKKQKYGIIKLKTMKG
jgi:hypothetical protein